MRVQAAVKSNLGRVQRGAAGPCGRRSERAFDSSASDIVTHYQDIK